MKKARDYSTFTSEKSSGEEFEISGYSSSTKKQIGFGFLLILTGGLIYLILRWFTKAKLKLLYNPCDIPQADHLLVEEEGDLTVVPIIEIQRKRYFDYRFMRYILSDVSGFSKTEFPISFPYSEMHTKFCSGLSNDQVDVRQDIYGRCEINVPVPTYCELFWNEAFHPFFVFQIFSIILWASDDYVFYAAIIFFILVISVIVELYDTKKRFIKLRSLAMQETEVVAIRDDQPMDLHSSDLVPGDLVYIKPGMVAFDALVLRGGCSVDESSLTGESVPKQKQAAAEVEYEIYNPDSDFAKKFTVYCGTKVVQTKPSTLAVVVRVGFQTQKGQMIREVIFPEKIKHFRFYQDSMKFIYVLFAIALLGFLWCVQSFNKQGLSVGEMIKRSLDLFTITIPPSLPAALTIGTIFAVKRLNRRDVNVLQNSRVNVAGRVSYFCFDKTGTLTEDRMIVKGVQVENKILNDISKSPLLLQTCLATCHSLTIMKDGTLDGDTQELAIVDACKDWSVRSSQDYEFETYGPSGSYGVTNIFPFTSDLKRMGVVVKDLDSGDNILLCKGSPEMITARCVDAPADLAKKVEDYSRRGYRVLACSYKTLYEAETTEQHISEIEAGQNYLGLILLNNKVKDNACIVVNKLMYQLEREKLKVIMSTGDDINTGISIAKKCGIIPNGYTIYIGDVVRGELQWRNFDETSPSLSEAIRTNDTTYKLALTGAAYEVARANSTEFKQILCTAAVFGRMSPIQKSNLIIDIQNALQVLVCMVGDGANDCSALKKADIGVSLSENEASLASPFSCRDLQGVIDTIREGRCALVTSFSCFKFMALYSMIQFIQVNTLYLLLSNLSDIQFVYIDLITIFPLAITMSYTAANDELRPKLPEGSLISFSVLSSIIGHTLLQALYVFSVFEILKSMTWFEPSPDMENDMDEPLSFENTVLFLFANTQYVIVCMAFQLESEYREPVYKNIAFVCTFVVLGIASLYLIVFPTSEIRDHMSMKEIPWDFRCILVGVILACSVIVILYERFLVRGMTSLYERLRKKLF